MAEAPVESRNLVNGAIGVLLPCRNEARVILRKLENLRIVVWPRCEAQHRVVLVDDGSTDDTAERARAWSAAVGPLPFELSVVGNTYEPGKVGAIRTALDSLAELAPDLLVLTDADVVWHPQSLPALSGAFENDPHLGIACGGQRFVRDLASDGSLRSVSQSSLLDAGSFYDRATAWVRAFESRFGKLVSVHGQLLAWRSELQLVPRKGIAADDLDLVFSARTLGYASKRVAGAWFAEVKTKRGPEARTQGERRARAWFQVFERSPAACLGQSALDRLQAAFYRWGPRLLPELGLALAVATVALAWRPGTRWLALGVGLVLAVLILVAPLRTIRKARRSTDGLSDRWDQVRED